MIDIMIKRSIEKRKKQANKTSVYLFICLNKKINIKKLYCLLYGLYKKPLNILII